MKGPAQGLDIQGSISRSASALKGLLHSALPLGLFSSKDPQVGTARYKGLGRENLLAALAKVGRCSCMDSSFRQTSRP